MTTAGILIDVRLKHIVLLKQQYFLFLLLHIIEILHESVGSNQPDLNNIINKVRFTNLLIRFTNVRIK